MKPTILPVCALLISPRTKQKKKNIYSMATRVCCKKLTTMCLNRYAADLLLPGRERGLLKQYYHKQNISECGKCTIKICACNSNISENIIQENRYMQSICMVKILCSFDEEIPKGTSWTKCYCRNVNAFRHGEGNSPDEDKLRQGHTLEKKAAYVACHVWNVCHMSTAMLLWHTNTHIHTNPD